MRARSRSRGAGAAVLGLAAVVCVVGLVVTHASGGSQATTSQQPEQRPPVFRGGISLVPLDVIVTDGNGRPVSGLTVADFEVYDKGRRQTIVAFNEVVWPLPESPTSVPRGGTVPLTDIASNASLKPAGRAFVFVIDVRPQQLPLYERVLAKLFSLVSPDDLVAVVFPRRSDLSVDFTSDPARLGRVLDRLRDASDNPDWRVTRPALENAVAALEPIPRSRKVIVWVSGGFQIELVPETRAGLETRETMSLARARVRALDAFEMLEKSRRAGAPIYAIDPEGLLERPTDASEFLKTASLATGGVSFVNRPFIVEAAEELMADNSHFYVLGFVPDPYEPDGGFRDVEVRLPRQSGLRVRSRDGYVAKPPPKTVASRSGDLTRDLAEGRSRNDLGVSAFGAALASGRGNRSRVMLTTVVRYPTGAISPEGKALPDDELSVVVMALDPDARVVASAQRRLRVPSAVWRRGEAAVTLNELFELPRGPVVFRIGVGSEATGGAGTLSLSLDVPVYSATRPGLSHLVVGVPGLRAGAQFDQVAALMPFQASTERRFASSSELQVFARVIGLSRSRPGATPIVTVEKDGVVLTKIPATLQASADGVSGHDIGARVPLAGLSTGVHVLTLTVTVPNQKPLIRSVQIQVD